MGMALTSCTVPRPGRPTFDLPDDQMEVGHRRARRAGQAPAADRTGQEIAEMLVEPILKDLDFTGGDGVFAFVNGMGGTPLLELYLMYGEVARILERSGVQVARSLVGNYMTSLDMAGCSGLAAQGGRRAAAPVGHPDQHRGLPVGGLTVAETVGSAELGRWLRAFADAVTENADELTALDSAIGDATTGRTCARA
jgi:hypothetical protein